MERLLRYCCPSIRVPNLFFKLTDHMNEVVGAQHAVVMPITDAAQSHTETIGKISVAALYR